ncbi:hypothetical protein JCM10212_002111 [Sporobolomyces blumeae]
MPFFDFVHSTAGRWCLTLFVLFFPLAPPLAVWAAKAGPGVPVERWVWWVLIDAALLLTGALFSSSSAPFPREPEPGQPLKNGTYAAFGGVTPLFGSASELSAQSVGLQVGLGTTLPYIACVILALYCIWEYKFTGKASNSGGGGNYGPTNTGDNFSLSKSERRRRSARDEESVEGSSEDEMGEIAQVRAKAARDFKRQVRANR